MSIGVFVYYAIVVGLFAWACTRPNRCELCGWRVMSSHHATNHELMTVCMFCDEENGYP